MEVPEKGSLVYLNFNPQSGHEQAGHRPAVVLSPKIFNQGSFAFVCPITTKKKNYPFEVEIPEGLKIKGVILADQLRSVDWRARNLKVVDRLPIATLNKCLLLINRILDFNIER
jgi:mRNA interferase MazF